MELSKTEVKKKIENYFSRNKIASKETRKIKKLAMKHRIRLGEYRKRFCKKCYADLRDARVRVTKNSKIVNCSSCGFVNRFRIS